MNNNDYHVVIAHYNYDLSWTNNLKYHYTIISKEGLPKEEWPNKANEASSYIKYIIDNYDRIHEYTIFIHDHRTSWHNKTNIDEIINNLTCNKDYNNINELGIHKISLTNNHFINFLETNLLHRPYNSNHHNYKPASMFYVHKNKILQYDLDFYKKLYDYIKNSDLSTYILSRLFEYSWHIIFTKHESDCST